MTILLPYLKDRFIQMSSTATLIALQLAIWPLYFKSSALPREIPFWYTLPTQQLLAPASYLWRIILLTAILWVINIMLGVWLYRLYPTISRILSYTSLTIVAMAAIAIIKTILIYIPLS